MAKKPSSGVGLLRSPAEQRARIEKAVREGRFQSALEQAKELHRHEPTPKHQELLVRVYIGRSRQLRTQGQTKDARIVLDNVIRLVGESSPFLAELTQELAACGDVQQSLKIMEKLPEGTASRAQLLASAADSAVEAGPRGRDKLP